AQRKRDSRALRCTCRQQKRSQAGARDILEPSAIDDHCPGWLPGTAHGPLERLLKARCGVKIQPAHRLDNGDISPCLDVQVHDVPRVRTVRVVSSDCGAAPAKFVTLWQMRSTSAAGVPPPCTCTSSARRCAP